MTMTDNTRLTIYEIINEKRREIYVGSTDLPIFQLVREIAGKRPKAIKHWDLSDATSVRSIEFELGPRQAEKFIKDYAESRLPSGWRYLLDD